MDRRIRTSLIGIVADIVLISIKGTLAAFTGSQALAADALHSLTDLFISFSVLSGILIRRWRERSADGLEEVAAAEQVSEAAVESKEIEEEEAPKKSRSPRGSWIEALVAYIVSLFILYMPYEILTGIGEKKNVYIQNVWWAILGTIACIAIAYYISRFKIMVGRESDSLSLEADGQHSRMDMYTSFAVLFSIVGQMIGIRLDPIVAVIIAVLIAITGLHLFVLSLVSLARKTDIKHMAFWGWLFSLADNLLGRVSKLFLGRSISLPRFKFPGPGFFKRCFTVKRTAVAASIVLAVYLLTGITVVEPDRIGVSLSFGAIKNARLEPGLHYHFPWPIGKIKKIEANHIYRVEIGFRTNPDIKGSISSLLWETRHSKQGYLKMKTESISLTGDINLLDLSLVVHYRPKDAVVHHFRINQVGELIRGLTESTMREVLATHVADSLFSNNRRILQESIKRKLETDADRLVLGVDILSVYIHDLHPPLDVVSTYRDVFSAREDKAKLLNEAESRRNESLPRARAKSTLMLADAQAYEKEKKIRAEGEAEKFKLVSKAYRKAPEVTAYRLFIETLEKGLSGKSKIIADPEANRGGYRMWMFSPNKGPFMESPGKKTDEKKK